MTSCCSRFPIVVSEAAVVVVDGVVAAAAVVVVSAPKLSKTLQLTWSRMRLRRWRRIWRGLGCRLEPDRLEPGRDSRNSEERCLDC